MRQWTTSTVRISVCTLNVGIAIFLINAGIFPVKLCRTKKILLVIAIFSYKGAEADKFFKSLFLGRQRSHTAVHLFLRMQTPVIILTMISEIR